MKEEKKKKTFVEELPEYLVIMAVTALVCTCVICFNKIPSESMVPTLRVGALTVSWRLPYLVGDPTPEHGNIVIFRSPEDEGKLLIKRVIGLPGDEIRFQDGDVYRNGEKLEEPYAQGKSYAPLESYTVPEGCMFVMGDNRSNSRDSRFMDSPYIPLKNIQSRFLFALQR